MTYLRGLFLALVAVSIFGCHEKPKDQFRYVEDVKVEGTCLEDHVQERWSEAYEGKLEHRYNITKNTHSRSGSVMRVRGLEKIVDEALRPNQYHPPQMVWFFDVPADMFALDTMTLKGVANLFSETTPSYLTTCKLTVVERRVPSQEEQEARQRPSRRR